MRPALYYAVRVGWRVEVVAVTTEKGHHWWGRTEPAGLGTHGSGGLRGRFDDLAGAQAICERVGAVRNHFAGQSDVLERGRRTLSAREREATDAIICGEDETQHLVRLRLEVVEP